MINEILKKSKFQIIVKPDCTKTEIIGTENDAIRLNVAAHADKNKANKEIIKFLSKKLKKKVVISSGLKSKIKIVEVKDI